MQMINLMQRLAELDAQNSNVVSEVSQELATKAYNKMAVGDAPWKNRTGLAGDQSDRMKARMDKRWGKDEVDAAVQKSHEQGQNEEQLGELSPDTLSNYARKAAGQGNWAGGAAKALDRRAADRESEYYRNSNWTDPNVKYSGEAEPYAKFSQQRAAGIKKAVAKGGKHGYELYPGTYGTPDDPVAKRVARQQGVAEDSLNEFYDEKNNFGGDGDDQQPPHDPRNSMAFKAGWKAGQEISNEIPLDQVLQNIKYPDELMAKFMSGFIEGRKAKIKWLKSQGRKATLRQNGSIKVLESEVEEQGVAEELDDEFIQLMDLIKNNSNGRFNDYQISNLAKVVSRMVSREKAAQEPQQDIAESLQECGMMGGMSQPHTPASINMSADSGAELTGMLKDIMSLAGLRQVGSGDLGHEHEPAVVTAEPGISVAKVADMDEPSMMRSVLDKLNPDMDSDEEERVEEWDNEPTGIEDIPNSEEDALINVGGHNHDQSGNVGGAETASGEKRTSIQPRVYEDLWKEYRRFVDEG